MSDSNEMLLEEDSMREDEDTPTELAREMFSPPPVGNDSGSRKMSEVPKGSGRDTNNGWNRCVENKDGIFSARESNPNASSSAGRETNFGTKMNISSSEKICITKDKNELKTLSKSSLANRTTPKKILKDCFLSCLEKKTGVKKE